MLLYKLKENARTNPWADSFDIVAVGVCTLLNICETDSGNATGFVISRLELYPYLIKVLTVDSNISEQFLLKQW